MPASLSRVYIRQQLFYLSGICELKADTVFLPFYTIVRLNNLNAWVVVKTLSIKLSDLAEIDLSYAVKLTELLETHTLVSVLTYNNEYRNLQHQCGFRWGNDSQHRHTRFPVKRRTANQLKQNLVRSYTTPRSNSDRQSHRYTKKFNAANIFLQPKNPL